MKYQDCDKTLLLVPRELRKGQNLSNFISYLKGKGIEDMFYMSDDEFDEHYKNFIEQL